MEAAAVPGKAPTGGLWGGSPPLLRLASDTQLVALVRAGRTAAFEAVYDRHYRAILGFCGHLLGDRDEAEDAVQHTFLSAYNGIVAGDQPIQLRPWLFTIARNRCYSMLRARREVAVAEVDDGTTEGPATLVQRREDLRDLVVDVNRLPADQRAALVMAELGALSHDEIAVALEVPRDKVKALVFQARESLLATRTARETDCAEIRQLLRSMRGPALRRGTLRRHLHECAGCRDYRRQLRHQRGRLAVVLPVLPSLTLKNAVLSATVDGRAAAASVGTSTGAGTAIKLGVLKPVVSAVVALASAAGAVVVVHTVIPPRHHHRVARLPTLRPHRDPRLHAAAPAADRRTAQPGSSTIRVTARAHATASAGALRVWYGREPARLARRGHGVHSHRVFVVLEPMPRRRRAARAHAKSTPPSSAGRPSAPPALVSQPAPAAPAAAPAPSAAPFTQAQTASAGGSPGHSTAPAAARDPEGSSAASQPGAGLGSSPGQSSRGRNRDARRRPHYVPGLVDDPGWALVRLPIGAASPLIIPSRVLTGPRPTMARLPTVPTRAREPRPVARPGVPPAHRGAIVKTAGDGGTVPLSTPSTRRTA